MNDLFYKRLGGFWDDVTPPIKKYEFLIRAVSFGRTVHSQISIHLLEGGAVEIRFVAKDHPRHFTDGVINTIFEDVSRLVRHYFPRYKTIKCKATFGKRVVNYEWEINTVLKARGITNEN